MKIPHCHCGDDGFESRMDRNIFFELYTYLLMNNINNMISKETQEKIWELRKNGMSILKISMELKIGKASVFEWCEKFDPDKKFNHTYKKHYNNQEIIDYYVNNNKNYKLTCKIFNKLSSRSIRSILIKGEVYNKRKQETIKQKSRRKSLAVINWKKDKKLKLIEYKGGKCQICGYNKCYKALDFHHIDPSKKLFDISSNSFSFEKMKQESDKCALLCANCHREIHADVTKLGRLL